MNKVSVLILLLSVFVSFPSFSQRKTQKLSTHSKGTMFGYFGYNRSAYSNSKISVNSPSYNFEINKTSLSDNSSDASLLHYFASESFQNIQFNFHLGYYVAHKWAITLGYDRLNIFTKDNQNVILTGKFEPSAHDDFEGYYENEEVTLSREQFYYRQSDGLNYVRTGVIRTIEFYKSDNAAFAFQSNIGLGLGLLFANTDFTINGTTSLSNRSISGFGLSSHIGGRFVFFQHFFLQTTFSSGLLSQSAIRLTPDAKASHFTAYFSPEISIGFNVFVRPTDGCATCPSW